MLLQSFIWLMDGRVLYTLFVACVEWFISLANMKSGGGGFSIFEFALENNELGRKLKVRLRLKILEY